MKNKIMIFEDSSMDLVNRYKQFNKNYELIVYLNYPYVDKKELKKEGFEQVYQGLPKSLLSADCLNRYGDEFIDLDKFNAKIAEYRKAGKSYLLDSLKRKIILNEEIPVDADFYCIDGLDGLCFEIVKTLPKEKVFINSGAPYIRNQAIKEGYKLLGTDTIHTQS
jgi:hypothetical protein